MKIVKEILEEQSPVMAADTELRTVQFADDCTNLVITDNEWQMEQVMTVCSRQYHCYFSTQGTKLNLSKEELILRPHSQAARVKPVGVKIDECEEADKVKLNSLISHLQLPLALSSSPQSSSAPSLALFSSLSISFSSSLQLSCQSILGNQQQPHILSLASLYIISFSPLSSLSLQSLFIDIT